MMWQVIFWDIASGTEVRQVASSEFDFGAGAAMTELYTNRHFMKAIGRMLFIRELPHGSAGGIEVRGEAVAFFRAPRRITSVRCHGATICLGCKGGVVCVLQAQFLAV